MNASAISYLIDSSAFIQAHRTYYAFNLCPGFWDSLIWLHKQGRVLSLDKVKKEISDGNKDALVNWIETVMPKTGFVLSDDAEVIDCYAKIQAWANAEPQFSAAAKAKFAADADAWLVAYAKVKNLTVVTMEVLAPQTKIKIPIPNVCKANDFQVRYIHTFEMLHELEVQFYWEEPS